MNLHRPMYCNPYANLLEVTLPHCTYLDIYISRKIRLCVVDLEGKFPRHDLRCAIASCELRCAVASCDVRCEPILLKLAMCVRAVHFQACDVRLQLHKFFYTITYKSRLTQKKLHKKTDAIFSIYG